LYWCCCGFGGRRREGEGVFQSSFDGSFFVVFGFPASVIGNSFRLGLGFESFPSFSGMGTVVGRWVAELLHGREMHGDVLCMGFGIDGLFLVSFFCVDAQTTCVLLWVVCVSLINGGAKSVTYNMPAARMSFGAFAGEVLIGRFFWYSFVHRRSFMYQHEAKSGWLLDPTFGGSVPLRGSSSPGDTGFLEVLEASDPSLPVDAMVSDHHLQPVRSAFIMHVDPDVLLKTAPKIHVLRQGGGRHQAGSSCRRRRGRPGMYKDLNVISNLFKGVFVIWAAITKYYE